MSPRSKDPAHDPVMGLLGSVNRKFGAGALMEMGSGPVTPVEVISSGSIALDVALGIGGLPRGRVVEIYGPESTGKTTFALHAIACAQRSGGVAVMVDAEHALDEAYARDLGVDTDKLLLAQPDTGEQGLEIASMAVKSGVVDIVVVDSVAALVPRAEIEGVMGDSHVGLQARMMSQALRILTPAVGSTRTTVIFVNQLREKIGVFYGNPETTTGGKALKFYASVRLDIRRIEAIKEGSLNIGHRVRVRVVKNKLSPPLRECKVDIIYGRGISREAEIVDLGVDHGVITRSGAWYVLPGGLGTFQGKEAARKWLSENSGAAEDLEERIREQMRRAPASSGRKQAPAQETESLLGPGSLADLAASVPVDVEK